MNLIKDFYVACFKIRGVLITANNAKIKPPQIKVNPQYMTSVGKGGGAEGPAKGLAPAHFFPLEGTGQTTATGKLGQNENLNLF